MAPWDEYRRKLRLHTRRARLSVTLYRHKLMRAYLTLKIRKVRLERKCYERAIAVLEKLDSSPEIDGGDESDGEG